jgi:lactoylglutathione lyase
MSPNPSVPDNAAKRSGPASFRGRTLSVSLTVKDLQKSLAWYRDVLGFTIDRRLEREGTLRGVAMKAGDVQLSINQDDGARGWDRVKGEGFSLRITTDQNVDEIANRIKELGGALDSEPADMPWGARIFRLRDPDGFKLTISSIPAA